MGGQTDIDLEAEVEAAIAADDVARLRLVAIEASLHHPDLDWATRLCLQLARHPDPIARGNAVLGLAHLGRRFRELDAGARPVVERALSDPERWVSNHARTAAYDLEHFLGWTFAVGVTVERELWSGRAAGRAWRARQRQWLAPGDTFDDFWTLVVETTDGEPREEIRCTWLVPERVLSGTLRGWSKTALGQLKRKLAQTKAPALDDA